MAEPSIARPLPEAHLADERRAHPVVLESARRITARERTRVGYERREMAGEVAQVARVETRTRLADVDEIPLVVDAEVDGAQMRARTLRRGVAADHEFL